MYLIFNIQCYLIKSGINLFYVWTGVSTCKIKVHNIIFIFIIFSDHIVLVFKLYQTILNHNITHAFRIILVLDETICMVVSLMS